MLSMLMIVVIHLLPTQMNLKLNFYVKPSVKFLLLKKYVTCQLPDDNSGILGMDAINMDESIIMSKLSKLNVNESAGPDDIYPWILFEARAQLAHPLFILFDTSLRVKKLPVDWLVYGKYCSYI